MIKLEDRDNGLFKCIRRGDRLALNTLFGLHYQNLCTFANTYLRNVEEAEECVADVFVNLWKSRKNLSIEKSFKSYLYTSVKYSAFAYLRKRIPAFEDIEDIQNGIVEDSAGPEQILLQAELEEEVDKIIETLPSRCRQVFLMSRTDALSYKEISAILNISEKTIENHLAKAIQILRKSLKMARKDLPCAADLTEA
jgi:RNA polymerase sigma-70 factor (ECF subfamily)